ncbi:MAG: hypothetical protein KC478_04570 [Bacteriovoracaceae bacterium]|nr:hypothetical protein [Bacteriovoracaceae bacterium]
MRKLLITITALVCFSSFGADETQKYVWANKVLSNVGILNFVSFVETVKNSQAPRPTNPYAPITALGHKDKSFYISFPANEYLGGLLKQMANLFTVKELQKIAKFYENPFYSKMITHLNTDASLVGVHKKLDLEKTARITKEKAMLLQKLIGIHNMNPLILDQKKQVKIELNRHVELLKILEMAKTTNTAKEKQKYETILDQFEFLILSYLGTQFEDYKTSELREIIRVMDQKLIQKAAQLFVSYHYYFMEKSLREFNQSYVPEEKAKVKPLDQFIR